MNENSPLISYRTLERSLVRLRLRTNGQYSPEEEPIIARMTALWNELTTEEQDVLSAEGPQALNARGGDYPMKVPLWLTTPPGDDWPEEARDSANYEAMQHAWDPLVELILPFRDQERGVIPGYFLRYSPGKFSEMVNENRHPVIDITLLPESKIPKNAVKVGKAFFTYVELRYQRLLLRSGGGDETTLIEQMDEAYGKLTPEEAQLVQSQGAWKFTEGAPPAEHPTKTVPKETTPCLPHSPPP
jgi:hypothetical protein